MRNQYFGRIDWMPNKKVWKVIGYIEKRDIEIKRVSDYLEAIHVLNEWENNQKKNKRSFY